MNKAARQSTSDTYNPHYSDSCSAAMIPTPLVDGTVILLGTESTVGEPVKRLNKSKLTPPPPSKKSVVEGISLLSISRHPTFFLYQIYMYIQSYNQEERSLYEVMFSS